MRNNNYHESVLVDETIEVLHIEKTRKYIDATLGNGGHALEIVKRGGHVLGIELDPEMLKVAEKRLASYIEEGKCRLVNDNFINISIYQKNIS